MYASGFWQEEQAAEEGSGNGSKFRGPRKRRGCSGALACRLLWPKTTLYCVKTRAAWCCPLLGNCRALLGI